MSAQFRSDGASLASYRDATENSAKMAGVRAIPAMELCVSCAKRRTAITGKYTKSGFVCCSCKAK